MEDKKQFTRTLGESGPDNNMDKAQYKPPGYKPIVYAPAQKIESEAKMDKVPQDNLQRGWTLWVMFRDQMYQKKLAGQYDESDLQDITSFDTVSRQLRANLMIFVFLFRFKLSG